MSGYKKDLTTEWDSKALSTFLSLISICHASNFSYSLRPRVLNYHYINEHVLSVDYTNYRKNLSTKAQYQVDSQEAI